MDRRILNVYDRRKEKHRMADSSDTRLGKIDTGNFREIVMLRV